MCQQSCVVLIQNISAECSVASGRPEAGQERLSPLLNAYNVNAQDMMLIDRGA